MNYEIDLTNVKLTTRRLILRPFSEGDLNDLFEYAKVSGLGEMAGWKHHESIEQSKAVLDGFINDKKTFAIVLKETGKVIGSISLEPLSNPKLIESSLLGRQIGYVIAQTEWNKGYATEAVKRLIGWCFDVKLFDFLECGHFYGNVSSQAVVKKCGFDFFEDTTFNSQLYGEKLMRGYILYNKKRYRLKVV